MDECFRLMEMFLRMRGGLQDRVMTLRGEQRPLSFECYRATVTRSTTPGRPSVHIDPEHVLNLREMGFNWKSIAVILGVSRSTLNQRRSTASFQGLNLEYSDIPTDALEAELRSIMSLSPHSGETFLQGALRARGNADIVLTIRTSVLTHLKFLCFLKSLTCCPLHMHLLFG